MRGAAATGLRSSTRNWPIFLGEVRRRPREASRGSAKNGARSRAAVRRSEKEATAITAAMAADPCAAACSATAAPIEAPTTTTGSPSPDRARAPGPAFRKSRTCRRPRRTRRARGCRTRRPRTRGHEMIRRSRWPTRGCPGGRGAGMTAAFPARGTTSPSASRPPLRFDRTAEPAAASSVCVLDTGSHSRRKTAPDTPPRRARARRRQQPARRCVAWSSSRAVEGGEGRAGRLGDGRVVGEPGAGIQRVVGQQARDRLARSDVVKRHQRPDRRAPDRR